MYYVRLVIMKDNNDRSVLIVDERELPVDEPCRFLISELNQYSYKTIQNKANTICQLLRWSLDCNICLLDQFRTGVLLNMTERDSLVKYLSKNMKFSRKNKDNIVNFYGYVSAEMLSQKINYVKEYFQYLCQLAIESKKITDPLYVALDAGLERLNDQLDRKKSKPMKKKRIGLDFEEQKLLLEVTKPRHKNNPYKIHTQERNYLALIILLLTGVRISELLSLRIENCIVTGDEPYIQVCQNTDNDPRLNKPEIKTIGRKIYISEELALLIDKYINGSRKFRGRKARQCAPYLFLNISKNPNPWSYSSVYSAIEKLRKRFPKLKDLTPHRLRHTFNDNFDLLFQDELTDIERDKFKKHICGWADDSKQPENYNLRATELQAQRFLKKMHTKFLSGELVEGDEYRNLLSDIDDEITW